MSQFKISVVDQSSNYLQSKNDTVLRAALRAGLDFPYECNSGGCGSCKFELIEGDIEEIWLDAPGLSKRDIRKGKKLACQCKAKTDLLIKTTLAQSPNKKIKPRRIKINFVEKIQLTADMNEFVFKAQDAAEFIPGQFALFELPNVVGERAYSMSNLPNKEGLWSFIIKQMPNGAGSEYLFNHLSEGEELIMDGPYGLAHLQLESDKEIICIGGGSGLSPMVSIARALDSFAELKNRKLHFFYGGRGPKDICTPELLSSLNSYANNLNCYAACSDEELIEKYDWDGDIGFIHQLVEKTFGEKLPQYEFYFCGPPPMTQAIQQMLMIEYKVPFEQLHFDRFF